MVNNQIDKTLNIRGEVCPYTFVKTKLVLETMQSGQVLEVITDHLPAVDNVTRSCLEEGHKLISKNKLNSDDWQLIIEKR